MEAHVFSLINNAMRNSMVITWWKCGREEAGEGKGSINGDERRLDLVL